MTLHDAIEALLRHTGRQMTIDGIANEINRNNWYKKKDGSIITAFQIHGRTKSYPHLFNRDGSKVSLVEQPMGEQRSQKKKPLIASNVKDDKIIFLNMGWMDFYKGVKGDHIIGGGKHVENEGWGGEMFNFQPFQNKLFGYVQPKIDRKHSNLDIPD